MKTRILYKFFAAFLFLILIATVVLHFFVSLKLRDYYEEKISHELRSNAALTADFFKEYLKEGKHKLIQERIATLANRLNLRITVIDPDGKVLADSEKNPTSMENHTDRLEIIRAEQNQFGQSTRFSDTLSYNMKYVAVRVDDNDNNILGYVRFASPLSQVQLQLRVIYRQVLFGAVAAVIIALTVAYFVSKSITLPIEKMKETAQQVAQGILMQEFAQGQKMNWGNWPTPSIRWPSS